MAQIYLVRHTTVNVPAGICYGATDVPLAYTFTNDAQRIKEQLKGLNFDYIFSSPLTRCTRLANFLSNNNYTTDLRLTELNFGEWEGKPWDDIYQTHYGKQWMDNYLELPCPIGESYFDLYNRVKSFINTLNKDDNILIITHAGVIKVCLHILSNKDLLKAFQRNIKNGEIIKIQRN